MKRLFFLFLIFWIISQVYSQSGFDGLNMNMGNLFRLSEAKTHSISPENFIGEKEKGRMARIEDGDKPNVANASNATRDLGQGWKVNPFIKINPGKTFTLAEIEGSGAIQHICMTPTGNWRFSIIPIYYDDEELPLVEAPVGDFFAMGWNKYAPLNSIADCVNPGSAFNCYWPMPFREKCKVMMENINDQNEMKLYYQIDYSLTEVPAEAAYFHAQFNRTNHNANSNYAIIDNVKGRGHFVGLYLDWGVNNNGWRGVGEIKFFIDGDGKFPTICGTRTEDYFCGSYNFDIGGQYQEFNAPYSGLHQVIRPNGTYKSQQRFGLYRWHILDSVRFEHNLKVTIQDLGWRHGRRYLPQKSDISSVAFSYQAEPHNKLTKLPDWEELEVN